MMTNELHTAMLGQYAAEIDPSLAALLCEARRMRAATAGPDMGLQARHWQELQALAITVAGVVLRWEAIGVGYNELEGRPVESGLVNSSRQLLVMLLRETKPSVREVDRTLDGLWTAAMDA